MRPRTAVLVLTRDEELLDQVLAVATAAAVVPEVVADAGQLLAAWDQAVVLVVGIDRVAELFAAGPRRRSDLYLVGREGAAENLLHWSVRLGAAVLPLPSGSHGLAAAFAEIGRSAEATGQVVTLVGGSGGVGTSTCAAAVAVAAARSHLECVLVDLDPIGGGLDLIMGAELDPGWRWPRLAGARGHLGDLTSDLLHIEGVDVLSMGRGPQPEVGVDQVTAVLGAMVRSHALTVVDLPRWVTPGAAEVIRRSDLVVMLTRTDVRGLASATQVLRRLGIVRAGLIARGRGGLSGDAVAERLGLELLDVIDDDVAVRRAALRGDLPGRSRRSRLARAGTAVLRRLTVGEVAA